METLGLTPEFWRERSVLITGHTGFKGGWLALWLHKLGARIAGYALPPPTTPSLFELADIARNIVHQVGDIRNYDQLLKTCQSQAPEIIFHLAAQPLVRKSYSAPLETIATNVLGTAHVLEAARNTPSVRAVVIVSSDKCYENHAWPWGYRESDRLGGDDPYSASKACTELITAAWRSSYWLSEDAPLVGSARAGNVIGGGDWAQDRLIPDLVHAALSNQPALVRNPAAVRPWQHVLEPLAGYLALGARLLEGERRFASAWNFGPALQDMQPVSAVCNTFCLVHGGRWLADGSNHPTEAAVLRLDNSHAVLNLRWRPRWPLSRALDATSEWYKRVAAGEDAYSLTLEQIDAYQADGETQ